MSRFLDRWILPRLYVRIMRLRDDVRDRDHTIGQLRAELSAREQGLR